MISPTSKYIQYTFIGLITLILTLGTLPHTAMATTETPVKAKPIKKPKNTPSVTKASEELTVTDAEDEILPDYKKGDRVIIGKMDTYTVGEEDTFLDIARHFNLGYVEMRAVNPDVDPWAPTPGSEVVIPSMNILPRAPQNGIVVNLGKMRLYYFKTPGAKPISYPLGIGREGLTTPTGKTTVVRKKAYPSWYPTPRMREEKPSLPASVPPGNQNPLGTHALYLGWPTFLIHGSNKPWGIGRRVSSGCLRMYPEDIIQFFDKVPVGTPVTVVDQPILVGWHKGKLYLEANPTKTQSQALEYDLDLEPQSMTDKQKELITKAAGDGADKINWNIVRDVLRERKGYPIVIATTSIAQGSETEPEKTAKDDTPKIKTQKTNYSFNN